MFIKIVVILLLVIVAASLLAGRGGGSGAPSRPRLRPLMLRVALALLALSAAVAALHLAGCAREEGRFHATTVSDADFARLSAFDGFTDHAGRRVASADFRGKVVVSFFGYTRCPDVCPTALAGFAEALRLLGPDADRVAVLFVTLDPAHDTREMLAGYVPWFDARLRGLRADETATRAAAREFRIYFERVDGGSALGDSLDHTATAYVHDTNGRLRLLIRDGTPAALIADDLRKLLQEADAP